MRTPLTSISAYTDLLIEDPALTDDHRQMLVVVQRNAATLRNIISDLLDFAALESGHAAIRLAPTDVSGIVRDALTGAGDLVAERSLTMVADVATDVTAAADGPRLRQVVDALLSNAVKYTPDGGTVTVRLSCVDGAAELSVADTGIGIPPEDRVKLFTRFFRGPAAKARGIPGSGLGLAIARAIVDKHGGTLALADTEGPGATFVLRLP
jgi:signal transduction histidine kinase